MFGPFQVRSPFHRVPKRRIGICWVYEAVLIYGKPHLFFMTCFLTRTFILFCMDCRWSGKIETKGVQFVSYVKPNEETKFNFAKVSGHIQEQLGGMMLNRTWEETIGMMPFLAGRRWSYALLPKHQTADSLARSCRTGCQS